MAFTPEDGTGVAAANSYQTLDEIKAHFADRGVVLADSFSDAEIEASAVKASDYMDKRFSRRYRGYKRGQSQGLEWPRLDAFDDDDFLLSARPKELLAAHSEYTLLDLQLTTLTPLPNVPFPTVDPETGTVSTGTGTLTRARDAVGPIETDRQYAQGTNADKPVVSSGNLIQSVREYPVADLWMESVIKSYTSRHVSRG